MVGNKGCECQWGQGQEKRAMIERQVTPLGESAENMTMLMTSTLDFSLTVIHQNSHKAVGTSQTVASV